MGRPNKLAPARIDLEDASQQLLDEESIKAQPKDSVSQSAAARSALDAGYHKPAEAVKYIKDTFGIDMNPQYFSSVKMRTKAAPPAKKSASPKAKAGRKPLVDGYVAPPEKPKAAGEPDVLLALAGVKELVQQFGPDRVKKMVDLLS